MRDARRMSSRGPVTGFLADPLILGFRLVNTCALDLLKFYSHLILEGPMHTTNLRKVGGSVMLAVPPALLDLLNLGVGAKVGIGVEDGRLVV